jgi:hypothetical protein
MSGIWRLAWDTVIITCNFLHCNHQVRRDFMITLYKWVEPKSKLRHTGTWSVEARPPPSPVLSPNSILPLFRIIALSFPEGIFRRAQKYHYLACLFFAVLKFRKSGIVCTNTVNKINFTSIFRKPDVWNGLQHERNRGALRSNHSLTFTCSCTLSRG